MLIVSYDISNNKVRTRFANFLSKFGARLQYSIFEITNSDRVKNNIVTEITEKYEKVFTQADSVIIFELSGSCRLVKFGYAKNDDSDLLIV